MLVFVRAPQPGRVKTRLAAAIGDGAALRVYMRLAEHTLAQVRAVAADGVAVRVHYAPPDAGDAVRVWLGEGPRYLPQAEGDLGVRMKDAFARAFAEGAERVVIVGSDLPEVSASLLRRAFELLDAHPAVVGPARDGGYYLLGLRGMIEGIFQEIEWSTASVLGTTVERMRAAATEPALLEVLADVDTVDDLPPGWLDQASSDPADQPGA
ncbi:TIGR04282 family arsenosugar biosynthesis glycosyltransferase [Longimicrobium sp.]|uniref:TIGR04282 family arsenosugar biosynthesis glycosyltransferase n=1 Tax=Longimicrobium sp. TaxID=2029185 RepID=UPI003B3BC5E7